MNVFLAGFGREDYTPDKQIRMNSVKYSAETVSPIMITCTALSDGEKTVLLFSNDLRGVLPWYAKEVKERVGEATGIPAEQIFVSATHNHSCPDINYNKDECIVDWTERIAFPAIVKAAKTAVEDLSPCTLKMGKAEVPKVTYTRRYFREDGAFHGIHVPKVSDSPLARHETEADPELRVLCFAREGKKDIAIVNFQVHAATALSTSNNLCADFITAVRDDVEAKEDVLVMYLQGGCGNSNTYSKIDPDAPNDDYLLAGHRIAEGVLRGLGNLEEIKAGKIFVERGSYEATVNHSKTHMAPLALELFRQIEREGITTEKDKRALFQANGFASRYEAAAINRRSKMGKTAIIPLASVCFGDVGFTFTPGEYFDVVFRQIRQASLCKLTMTVGYSETSGSYMPSSYGFANGGYEPLQCNYIPGTSECCALELIRQINSMKTKVEQ